MSERKLSIGGTAYIRSRDAARLVRLAPDYVSRLARGQLIDGRQIDGLWFVNLASLKTFIAEQERQKEIWRAELARQRTRSGTKMMMLRSSKAIPSPNQT
jgi:hypothetical protein